MKKLISSIVCMIIFTMCFSSVLAEQGFSDLPDTHWAFQVVSDFVQKGIINGFEDSTFRPDESVTRAQLAKLIALAANMEIKQEGNSGFADVTPSDWYYSYIKACQDIFSGEQRFPDGLYMFYPDTQASRLVAALAVVKALKLDVSTADTTLIKGFKDLDGLGETDCKYLALAMSNGIILGYPDQTFKPNGKLTRAEATAVLIRAFFKN